MQIYVENAAGLTLLPAESSKENLLYYNNILLICLEDKESIRLDINGTESSFELPGEYRLPLIWDSENKCLVTIRFSQGFIKYTFRLENSSPSSEEEITNLLKFVNQLEETFKIDNEYSIEDLFKAIKDDEVALIIEKTPYMGYDDQSLLRKISETVPMVMDICSHPKQSLRTEEAILDVNLVKRINSRTMDHLASHSEHWKARTLNGLIPNRLRADIFEDEINIYENLFFRMAIEDVLKYVHKQAVSIRKTIEQNDNAIDWNAYGMSLFDYKRMKIFEQLLPNYDVAERQNENKTLRDLLNQWEKLEKHFSTVEASQFYRSIDKKKHISRNIQPTNILKKDSRYNALYRLWCEIQRQVVQEQQESLDLKGDSILSLSDCYSMYVIVMTLYAFKLLDCELHQGSTFMLANDGALLVNATFSTDNMTYILNSERNQYGAMQISLSFVEKVSYVYPLPAEVSKYIKEIKNVLPQKSTLDEQNGNIIFYSNPTQDEQKELSNIFHLSQAVQKGLSSSEKEEKKLADKAWRQNLVDLFSSGNIRDAKVESITIIPQFVDVDISENAFDKFTKAMLDSSDGHVFFVLPIDISEYKKTVTSEELISRLLNYGEKYQAESAEKWGDYKTGIIPVAQAEINSAQRLMKLISTHSTRLQIKWSKKDKVCPICGLSNCVEESAGSWKCKNKDCGILFGTTKHADGCGVEYEWTRPYVDIKKSDIEGIAGIDLMLKKELIFDRLVITDFDFENQSDGTIKYIPICPKCGRRSI